MGHIASARPKPPSCGKNRGGAGGEPGGRRRIAIRFAKKTSRKNEFPRSRHVLENDIARRGSEKKLGHPIKTRELLRWGRGKIGSKREFLRDLQRRKREGYRKMSKRRTSPPPLQGEEVWKSQAQHPRGRKNPVEFLVKRKKEA